MELYCFRFQKCGLYLIFHVKMKTFHSGQEMALFENKLGEQGSISVLSAFSRCSNTFRCSQPRGWPELAGLWHIQMWE